MNNFKLNDSLNKNKVFLVNRSEIGGRLDPLYYYEDLDFTNTIKLGSITKITGGKRLPKENSYELTKTPYRYLRIGDIDSYNQLHYEDFEYLSEKTFNILIRYEISNGDIALAIVGATIGKCVEIEAPYKDRIILTENCAKIHIENKNVYSKFLLLVLQSKFVQKQIELNYIQTTLPKLGLDRVYNLRIPKLPLLDVQKNIVLKYNILHSKSREKQYQSKNLLKSIDSYLLNELGIELPKNDNSLKARIFTTKFCDVCGGRLDPLYMVSANILHSRKYSQQKLSEVCSYFSSGFGAGKEDQKNAIDGIIQIRPTNIDENCDLKFDKNIYVDEHQNISKIEKTDVLFNNTNSQELVGKTALGELAEGMYYSNHITVIKTIQSELNPLFLKETLNLLQREKVFFSICTNWNNQSGVGLDLLKTISIPLPPLSKQIEIAEHIKEIRSQAKQLEIESEQILTDAKKEIEKMILGE